MDVIVNRRELSIAISSIKTSAFFPLPARRWTREQFIEEAVRRAVVVGYYPAELQREIDWDVVQEWAERVRQPGFTWRKSEPWATDAIVVGPRRGGGKVIHSGQHRILGGLMGGNPVPGTHVSRIGIEDAGRGWREPVRTPDLSALLAL